MKLFLWVCCFVSCSVHSFAQEPSLKSDLMAKQYLKNVPGKMIGIYKYLLSKRTQLQMNKRMDSIQYDYVYIEERFNQVDSSMSAVEYYFNTNPAGKYQANFEDSSLLPDQLYQNGQLLDLRYVYYSSSITGIIFDGKYEYYYTLDSILGRCASLLPFQELSYDRTPRISNLIIANSTERIDTNRARNLIATNNYKKMLSSTYQIVTLVDQVNNRMTVSIQSPARHPEIIPYSMQFQAMDW